MRLAFGDFDMTPSVAALPLIATMSNATELTDPPNTFAKCHRLRRGPLMEPEKFNESKWTLSTPGRMAYHVASCKPDLNSLPVNALAWREACAASWPAMRA